MKLIYASLLLLLIVIMVSCKKTDNPSTSITPNNPVTPNNPDTTITPGNTIDVPENVYIAGFEITDSFYTLKYWNNGKVFTINTANRYNAGAQIAQPTSIFVSESDVYITGFSSKNDNTYPIIGKYWKNGNATDLTDSLKRGTVNSVFVTNNDVYMVGSETTQLNNLVEYWKNGVAFPLIDGPIAGAANSIFVSTNDVYVAGNENLHPFQSNYSALYWKNANRIILSNDSVESAIATSVFVSGNDVYVAGDVYTGTHTEAVYWKNGVRVILSLNDSFDEHTSAIGVSGNDVYVSGYAGYIAKYWKNDSSVNLTDGKYEGRATSLCIANGDVYIAGYDYDIPKYWKNGVVHVIQPEPWYQHAFAYSIFVTK